MTNQDVEIQKIKKQRGMTMISWAVVISIVGFLALMAINIIPHFINDATVAQVMTKLDSNKDMKTATAPAIKKHILKQLKINNVYHIKADQIKISKSKRGVIVRIAYEPRGTLIGKVDYIISFKHEALISK